MPQLSVSDEELVLLDLALNRTRKYHQERVLKAGYPGIPSAGLVLAPIDQHWFDIATALQLKVLTLKRDS